MSQWIIPVGSVGSREAGSIPHFSLKLASFLTEGRQLAGALFFCPGKARYKHLPKIGLFIRRRLRNIACLADLKTQPRHLLSGGSLAISLIPKGAIERTSRTGQKYICPLQVSLSSAQNSAGGSTSSIFSPRFTSPYPHCGGVFF